VFSDKIHLDLSSDWEEVERKQEILAGKMNDKRRLANFEVGELVMAKDVTRESKWEAPYVGPFRVIRCNKGGAYILEDRAKRVLPFRFSPSHLNRAPYASEPTAFTKTGSDMPMRSSQIEGMGVESSGTDAFLHTGMVTRSKQNRVLKFGEGKCDVDLPSEN
jgi:hypothetical protein